MALAAAYAAGVATGAAWLTIPAMVRLHGIANGVGFALVGLLGWTAAERHEARAAADGTSRWRAGRPLPG